MSYKLDGLPSDLLSSAKENVRRLKVDASVSVSKTFTYNEDGTIDTITELNLDTNVSVVKQFSYDVNGNLISIIPQ